MIKTNRELLIKALERCSRVGAPRSTIVSLGHTLLDSSDGKLKCRATNLKLEVSCDLPSTGDGAFSVETRKLLAAVSGLSGESVSFDSKDGVVHLKGDTSRKFKLPTLPAEDFPGAMSPTGESFDLEADKLAELFDSVEFTVSRDAEANQACIQLTGTGTALRAAAIGGIGWCVVREVESTLTPEVLVPIEVARLVAHHHTGNVTLTYSQNCVSFLVDGIRYSAAQRADAFPPILDLVARQSHPSSFTVPVDAFLASVKAIQIVDADRDLRLKFSKDKFVLECLGDGAATDEIDVECGPEMMQFFDGARMAQALSSMDGDVTVSYGPTNVAPLMLSQPGRKIVAMPRMADVVESRKT